MELAVVTDDISQDLDHAIEVMAANGVSKAEIRGTWGVEIADASDDHIDRILAAVTAHDVKIVGIATQVYRCYLPSAAESSKPTVSEEDGPERPFADQLALVQRCIDIALKLGATYIRVFTFDKVGELTPEIENEIVEAFVEPSRLASAAGVVLLVENDAGCYIGTGVQMARLLGRINSPSVRCLWDPESASLASEVAFPNGYGAVKTFINHVHVRNVGNQSHGTVGEVGAVDWLGQLRALRVDDYRGYVSLELGYGGGGKREAISLSRLAELKSLMAQI